MNEHDNDDVLRTLYEAENAFLRDKKDDFEKQYMEAVDKLEKLKLNYADIKKKHDDVDQTYRKLNEECLSLQEDKKMLQEKVNTVNKKLRIAKEENNKLKQKNSTFEVQKQVLEKEKAELERKLGVISIEHCHCFEKLNEQINLVACGEKELRMCEKELRMCEKELRMCEKELHMCEKKLLELELEHNKLQPELAQTIQNYFAESECSNIRGALNYTEEEKMGFNPKIAGERRGEVWRREMPTAILKEVKFTSDVKEVVCKLFEKVNGGIHNCYYQGKKVYIKSGTFTSDELKIIQAAWKFGDLGEGTLILVPESQGVVIA